jgi:hypothetical protein
MVKTMLMSMSRRRRPGVAALALVLAGGLGLAGCAAGQGGGGTPGYGGLGSPNVGTAAGAVSGAALGRAVAGRNNNLVAILGGAALGGLAGNVFLDKPSGARRAAEAEAASDREQQRRLDYERQSELQREETRRQIEEQRLFEDWKAQRAAGVTGAAAADAQVAAVNRPADVTAAQRLLTALGYYNGPVDGRMGAQTRSAVMQFEGNQGLPQTGVITPSIVSRMRASL